MRWSGHQVVARHPDGSDVAGFDGMKAPLAPGKLGGARLEWRECTALDDALASEIDSLSAAATEPNPFYESWCLRPALALLDTDALMLLCIRSRSGRLIGLMPLSRQSRFKRLPLRSLKSWGHDYVFLASPLVHRDHVDEAVGGLLDWLASGTAPAGIIELITIRMDGPLVAALDAGIATRRKHLLCRKTRWTRACYRLDVPDNPAYLSARQRSTLRRKERRLADEGAIEGSLRYSMMSADEDPDPWLERFLQVEASGWKGQQGTAMAASATAREFFLDACRRAHTRGQLHMLSLELDGRPVAMKCNFLAGSRAFTFKIAYDEAHAKHSPGILIELFQMRQLRDTHPGLIDVDSCTVADNTMFPGLWPDECVLGDYVILRNTLIHRVLLRHGARVQQWLARCRKAVGR